MTDQLPRIVLSPTSDATTITPPPITVVQPSVMTPVSAPPASTTTNVPLQPVPPVKNSTEKTLDLATQSVSHSNTLTPTQLQQQEQTLVHNLEKINQEENKLLGTIKDWIGWIQGAETKKQTIEHELKAIDQELQASTGHNQSATHQPKPVPPVQVGPSLAELKAQLHAAQSKCKAIQDQQKIEENKAFDHYAAGSSNREELMKEMERISKLYDQPIIEIKAKITALETDIHKKIPTPDNASTVLERPTVDQSTLPSPTIAPTTKPVLTEQTFISTDQTTPETSNYTTTILAHLRTLEQAQSGVIQQLLVDLPQQGQNLTIQRPAEGNGILVLAGTEKNYTLGHHFSDADLIQAGLGADDIIALPTGTLTADQLHS